jgi:hypothetical protein
MKRETTVFAAKSRDSAEIKESKRARQASGLSSDCSTSVEQPMSNWGHKIHQIGGPNSAAVG